MKNYEVIIIGAGIVGLAVARELQQRGFRSIAVLEKEDQLGLHASGKNSGVIHAGIYYGKDSKKLQFCLEGARKLYEFAEENQIHHQRNGKVIVAKNEVEKERLLKLHERALSNGVDVELIDEYELKELEPQARTFEKAIFSKNTGFIDSKSVLHNVYSKIQENQGEVLLSFDVQDINWSEKVVRDQKGQKLGFGKLINCAGMWADRWAHSAGLGLKYRILPFRGSYRKWLSPPTVKRSIYPVPDPELPFLGVHVTPTLGGEVLLGPNAFPAWERGGGVELRTAWSSVASLAEMFLKNKSGLRHHVYNEVQRWGKSSIFEDLQRMAPAIEKEKISGYQKSGLRAQLVNTEKMQFEMDFVIEKNKDSVHVLNAVSPGFTSSFAFAEEVVDELGEL